MPKRKIAKVSPSNTLHNYFSRTPPANKKVKPGNGDSEDSPTFNIVKSENKKRVKQATKASNCSSSEDEAVTIPKKWKRVRFELSDSDSEKTDVIPTEKKSSTVKKLEESFKFEANQSPRAKKTESNNAPKPESNEEDAVLNEEKWTHCKLEWLKPHKIRDAQKRRPDHSDYDPTTLYVPPEFYTTQTPAHKQWWEIKSSHFDCVLFFKVGKFYELYHMDAAVGVNELGFSYMKGDFAHSGFPESAYARMASTLVSKGYKVARIEQTETPEMMQERYKNMGAGGSRKAVRREVCQVTALGTQVCGLQDNGPPEARAHYLLALAEEERQGCSIYGVCFVDTSIGLFHVGQFEDDKHSSRLLTTLAHYPPALIVYDKKATSARTSKLIKTHCHSARHEPLVFLSAEKALHTLAEKYYKDATGDWPESLKGFLHEGDALGLTPAPNFVLAIKSLGGCVAYLTNCLLDIQILGMSQFTLYEPPDVFNQTISQEEKTDKDKERWERGHTMVLDAITLKNLRIVQDEGCLYDKLNFCSTAMGKRLLYRWVCAPSCNLSVIKERQEAVKTLLSNQELCEKARNILTKLPDLERLLAKVHSLGNPVKSKTHPDSRAIFYEEKIYSKRKVMDFISVINGFGAALKLGPLLRDVDSVLVLRVTQFDPEGMFPNYEDTLKVFSDGFDHDEAEKEGRILPAKGVDAAYDNVNKLIDDIGLEMSKYLIDQEVHFRCRLTYVSANKKRYLLEVPESAVSRANSSYQLEGARKGYKKYSTAETREFLSRMQAAEDQKTNVLKDVSRRIFEKFSSHYNEWVTAVECLATLDILLSLVEFARQQSGDVCVPQITSHDDVKPYIKIVEGRHPCIPNVNDFIPNDTSLGEEGATLLLLTGPNMGGKSTLMRQVGLITVLAHLGSVVPAKECFLTLVDRIFTRLGASDDILSGQSTFLVEMNETAAIVKHATEHSLVLLDELGRGTSTHDGTAIASGVCVELAARACRTIFSTHYHSLVHHLADHPGVFLGHMACMVETDESTPDNEDQIPEETITFLYKLTPGACPKSYGFNAARLAGIPKEVTQRGHQISKDLENEATSVQAFRNIFKKEPSEVPEVMSSLCQLSLKFV